MTQGCKAQVTAPGGWHSFPCSRNAKHEGYCWQHHPDSVKARREKSREKSQREYENSPVMRLIKAREEIEILKREIEELKRELSEKS